MIWILVKIALIYGLRISSGEEKSRQINIFVYPEGRSVSRQITPAWSLSEKGGKVLAKVVTLIPKEITSGFEAAKVQYTVVKGAIYYHSVEDYKAGQQIIKSLEKKLPQQGYNKYGNKKVKLRIMSEYVDSGLGTGLGLMPNYVTFDSEDEADYYFCLKDQRDAGTIIRIQLHPRLELFPSFIDEFGDTQAAAIYTPDFYVEYKDGRREYVDVKGQSTEAGDLRRKLYNYLAFGAGAPERPFRGISLRWVATSFKYGDENGWIDWDLLQGFRKKAAKAKKDKQEKKGA